MCKPRAKKINFIFKHSYNITKTNKSTKKLKFYHARSDKTKLWQNKIGKINDKKVIYTKH